MIKDTYSTLLLRCFEPLERSGKMSGSGRLISALVSLYQLDEFRYWQRKCSSPRFLLSQSQALVRCRAGSTGSWRLHFVCRTRTYHDEPDYVVTSSVAGWRGRHCLFGLPSWATRHAVPRCQALPTCATVGQRRYQQLSECSIRFKK